MAVPDSALVARAVPLADLDVYARRLNGPAATADTLTEAQLDALAGASARFRADAGHHITRTEYELELDGDGGNLIPLPFRHVHELTVYVNQPDGTRAELDPAQYQVSRRDGLLRRRSGVWPDTLGAFSITATAGLDTIPGDIAEHVMTLAEYVLTTEIGVGSKTVGGQQVSWTAAAFQVGITEPWAQCVARYAITRGDEA